MASPRLILAAVLIVSLLSMAASAQTPLSWVVGLKRVAFALGWIMMVFMGVKWIVADSANERAEAKKGMIYIVIGLLIVASVSSLLQMYCDVVASSGVAGFTCTAGSY